MDTRLFIEMLSIDSTSGQERAMGEFLVSCLKTPANTIETFEVGDGTINVLAKWGEPKVYFCSHMDTVPPYIPPQLQSDRITGRGSCDAKGQVFAMFEACRRLEAEGRTGFALLVLSGEETGSFGAKAYTRDCQGGEIVIVGEPTDNRMVTASKGTKSFDVRILGKSCHSGYPERGVSAVERFIDFMEKVRTTGFPEDKVLGSTTYNVGLLSSPNQQNILSPELTFRIYFRTTFASDSAVCGFMESMKNEFTEITARGGDTPMEYLTVAGIPQTTVAFGSDAPQLHKFSRRALCGPGSILVAHTPDEFVLLEDLEKAAGQYVKMYKELTK
ncbi:MAG: M20/M25/M40 family metallo-hydrolase [Bacteroidota bacterium]|nr:M20/M25/M40 family metallo-hydrolase [Bacteroidota bacterium]